jgi:hypothetical protein
LVLYPFYKALHSFPLTKGGDLHLVRVIFENWALRMKAYHGKKERENSANLIAELVFGITAVFVFAVVEDVAVLAIFGILVFVMAFSVIITFAVVITF